MYSLRAATTVERNNAEDINSRTLELFDEVLSRNNIDISEVESLIISCTSDIDAVYPAKIIREKRNAKEISFMHFNEMKVIGSLKLCIRFLMFVKGEDKKDSKKNIYLHNARILRPDSNK